MRAREAWNNLDDAQRSDLAELGWLFVGGLLLGFVVTVLAVVAW